MFVLNKNMRLQHEIEIFSTVIKNKTYGMEGEYLIETSIEVAFQDRESRIIDFDNITFPTLLPCKSFFQGSYNLQKETYNNWVSINNQKSSLASWVENHQLTLISEAEYNQYNVNKYYPYRSFNRLTRPGFSLDFSQAIIQIYSYSPGAYDYGSILYLERVSQQWDIKSSYGLYNQ